MIDLCEIIKAPEKAKRKPVVIEGALSTGIDTLFSYDNSAASDFKRHVISRAPSYGDKPTAEEVEADLERIDRLAKSIIGCDWEMEQQPQISRLDCLLLKITTCFSAFAMMLSESWNKLLNKIWS